MEDQEAMEEQGMEVIRELADLERERDKEVNKLKRKVRQTVSRINFSQGNMFVSRRFMTGLLQK